MNDRLPPTARLQLHKIDDKIFQPQEYVPLLDLPSGRGLVYLVALAASSSSYQFWEGCIHLYTPHDEPFPGAENAFVEPLWALKTMNSPRQARNKHRKKLRGNAFSAGTLLSTGTEDYFGMHIALLIMMIMICPHEQTACQPLFPDPNGQKLACFPLPRHAWDCSNQKN